MKSNSNSSVTSDSDNIKQGPAKTNTNAQYRSSYCNDWIRLFDKSINLDELRSQCLSGCLQSSPFRSVAWRVLLGCLPLERANWPESLAQIRQSYTQLKDKVCLNPRLNDQALDPNLNNPLSQHTHNPWQQYFADAELNACIHQDVERTFPEVEYFQSVATRQLMERILFVYAKQNPRVSYKQGMHEIVGPLLFVLFYDHQAYVHSAEHQALSSLPEETQSLLKILMDESFMEHDAYNIFSQIMRIIEPWYCVPAQSDGGHARRQSDMADEPFLRPQDRTTSQVVTKLNWIGDTLLRQADPRLYKHLENMEIAPQIYGIRWLRLLFGREFPIQDLLLLWDAIFADGAPFVLVDFLFVTMLIYIRDLLLHSDYTGCLHYLMRYPPVVDVNCFLALALHIRNPKRFPKPNAYSFMNFTHITVTGRPHPNLSRERIAAAGAAADKGTFPERIIEQSLEKTGKVLNSINRMGAQIASSLKDQPPHTGAPALSPKAETRPARINSNVTRPAPKRPPPPVNSRHIGSPLHTQKKSAARLVSDEELELLKEQVSCLQMRLSEVDAVTQYSAGKLEHCADAIEDGLSPTTAADDPLRWVLSELRQVSRLLRGKSEADGGSPIEIGSDPLGAVSPDKIRGSSASSVPSTPTIAAPLSKENELKDMSRNGD